MGDFKLNLDQKLLLKLSPQQIQFMQLLQLPTLALEQRIKEELEMNPALEEVEGGSEEVLRTEELDSLGRENAESDENEEGVPAATDELKEWDIDDYISDEDRDDDAYKSRDNNYPSAEDSFESPIVSYESFQEYLNSQFYLLPLSEMEQKIGEVLIGNLDENGYLQRSVEALVNDLAFFGGLSATEPQIEKVLQQIQRLDPPGVGARNLRECLLIQLQQLQMEEGRALKVVQEAQSIVSRCFEDLINRRFERMLERLHLEETDLEEALALISGLNPKPGSAWLEGNEKNAPIISPDFYLTFSNEGEPVLSLHSHNDPNLRISEVYNQMLQSYRKDRQNKSHKEAALFVKERIDSARWFIDMIHQRQNTLLSIGKELVLLQKDYFLTGDLRLLKPMRLKDIAEKTGYDISTISRVTAQKYMQTPLGMVALKQLFSQGMADEEGHEISTSHIKEVLKNLIEQEDKMHPLADEEVVEVLKKEGLAVARRTVAKYRQALGFPVARLRRELKN